MRILVTGGTGYLGTALCRVLVGQGHQVQALVRENSDTSQLLSMGVNLFCGDITHRFSLREGMSGCDWVAHLAGETDPAAPPDRLESVNAQGAENVASLAFKLGVGRLLNVSSMAAFGGSPADGSPATEETERWPRAGNRYSASKREGEKRVRAWAEQGLKANTVLPSMVYGPPGKSTGANALLASLAAGRAPLLVGADRKTSWVFVDDVVEACVSVLTHGEPGEDFLLAGEVVAVRDLAKKVCQIAGSAPPRREISARKARIIVALARPFLRLHFKHRSISGEQLRTLERHWAFDDSKARETLGWAPRSLDEGLPPTLECLGFGEGSELEGWKVGRWDR